VWFLATCQNSRTYCSATRRPTASLPPSVLIGFCHAAAGLLQSLRQSTESRLSRPQASLIWTLALSASDRCGFPCFIPFGHVDLGFPASPSDLATNRRDVFPPRRASFPAASRKIGRRSSIWQSFVTQHPSTPQAWQLSVQRQHHLGLIAFFTLFKSLVQLQSCPPRTHAVVCAKLALRH